MTDSLSNIDVAEMPNDLKSVIATIGKAASALSTVISLGDLYQSTDIKLASNADGDEQKSLDIIADNAYFQALKGSPVLAYASEEREDITIINEHGSLLLAIDPLDGSSNIECNLSIGSIFSIREYKSELGKTFDGIRNQFLRPGSEQIAAGYIIFGPQTIHRLPRMIKDIYKYIKQKKLLKT